MHLLGKCCGRPIRLRNPQNRLGRTQSAFSYWDHPGPQFGRPPTYDAMKRLVYIGTGDNYSDPPSENSDAIAGLNGDTGATVCSRQMTSCDAFNIACNTPKPINCPNSKGPDLYFGSSMILVELDGGRRALIRSQKSGVVSAVDPEHYGRPFGNGASVAVGRWAASYGDRRPTIPRFMSPSRTWCCMWWRRALCFEARDRRVGVEDA